MIKFLISSFLNIFRIFKKNNRFKLSRDLSFSTLINSYPNSYPLILGGALRKSNIEYSIDNKKNEYRKGLFDDFFLDNIPHEIKKNMRSDIYINNYKPDLVYFDEFKKVYLAIEIDEPYTLNEKELKIPIHTESKDCYREESILNSGWTIIRFAEEQIAKHINDCVQLIINAINSKPIYFKNNIKRWDEDGAYNYIINNYRETYISRKLILKKRNSDYSLRSFELIGFIKREEKDKIEIRLSNKDIQHFVCYIKTDDFMDTYNQLDFIKEIKKIDARITNIDNFARFRKSLTRHVKFNAYGNINDGFFNIYDRKSFDIQVNKIILNQYIKLLKVLNGYNSDEINENALSEYFEILEKFENE